MKNKRPSAAARASHAKIEDRRVVTLFSGSGGLDLGFDQAGFQSVLAIDIDLAACVTYKRNHPHVRVIRQDLSTVPTGYVLERLLEMPNVVKPAGVVGGPPCQPFSVGNVHKRRDDPRAKLPEKYARILKELNERYSLDFFVFENVRGLRHKVHLELFDLFKQLFNAAGFSIFEAELDAQDFGVAQVRKRVFVVGFNAEKYPGLVFEFPSGTGSTKRTVRDVIGDLPTPIYFKRRILPNQIPFHPNHWCMNPRSTKFSNGFLKEGDAKGRPFRVLEWDRPSWTVAYGHREVHVHPTCRRRLSVYEAMLLQGFPRNYELCGNLSEQIRLVSDAVPPPLARGLAIAIADTLEEWSKSDTRRALTARA